MKYDYVFFDMDGVLIDSMKFHVECWQRALSESGIVASEDELKKMGGVPFKETVEKFARMNNKDVTLEEIHEIAERKYKYFFETFKLVVYDGVYDLLDFLKDRGVKVALVSGAIRSVVEKVVNSNFEGYFDYIVTANDYENGKPSPDPYLMAYDFFKCDDKNKCLVVEDAVLGVESGLSAGMDVFAVETTLDRKFLGKATRVFSNQREIFEWFEKDE